MSRIIDAHSHYMPQAIASKTTFFRSSWSDLDWQLATMKQFGIEKAVLLYPTSDAHLNMGGWKNVCEIYNEEISKVVRKYSRRLIGAGILPLDSPEDIMKELSRFKSLKLSMISLPSSFEGKYLDDDMFTPVFEYAQKNRMPIHVHPQIINPIGEDRVKDPLLTPVLEYVFDVSMSIGKLMMNEKLLAFPDVKLIFAHYGGVLPFVKERFDNTYLMLRKRGFVKDLFKLPSEYFKNLYFDIAGSKSPSAFFCALEVTDASHILFGSDFPANQDILGTLNMINRSPLSTNFKDAIFFKNAKALLDI